MLQEWLGADQTIDLGQWAAAMGLRRAYLDTLPNRRWAGHLIVLNERREPHEILRATLDDGIVRLRFLPADALKITGAPAEDLASLALRIAAASSSDPPLLFTILMDRRAVSELLIAAVAGSKRSEVFRTRLAAGYGRRWVVQTISPISHHVIQSALKGDLRARLKAWNRQLEGQTLIFHRNGAPATRGGVWFTNGQFHMLAPEELISVPGATWIDERLLGELLSLLDEMFKQPSKCNTLAIYTELNSLLKRGYLRLPDNKHLPLLRLLSGLVKRKWLKLGSLSQLITSPPLPPAASLTFALYFQVNGLCDTGSASGDISTLVEQRYRPLLEILARHPKVRATIGWTDTVLEKLASDVPDVLERYRAGVEGGRFETVCVLNTLPFSLLTSPDVIHARALIWETIAAREAQLWARGVVPVGRRLSAGWGEALRGQGYQYVALGEESLWQAGTQFDPTRPLSVEGWPVVGFHRELGQVLRLGVDEDTLADYMRYLAADYAEKTLAVAIPVDMARDLSWLDQFLEHAEKLGCSFVLLSELASAHAQGIADTSAVSSGLGTWTGDETSRQLNASFSRAWSRWQGIHALSERVRIQDRSLASVQRAALNVQWDHRHRDLAAADARQAIAEERSLAQRLLLKLGSLPTLPERALGVLRVFEPYDFERPGSMFAVQIPLPVGMSLETVAFLDKDIVVPSQWLPAQDDKAHFLLAVDLGANMFKDLVVFPESFTTAAEGLDITSSRLCNSWLTTLLDKKGQVTSIRFQGQERLCGLSNRVRGYLLNADGWLRPELAMAEITVTSKGPLRGTVMVRQVLTGDVELIRHLHVGLSSPLIECVTELHFPTPQTMAGQLIVGEFDVAGEQASWAFPLQAGRVSHPAAEVPPIIFAAQDAVDVHTGWTGLRYIVHRATTRTYQYAAQPISGGVRLGLFASMPGRVPDPVRLGDQPGLGFPGHKYHGRYVYRYALLPLVPDMDARMASYNRPPLWAFYLKRG